MIRRVVTRFARSTPALFVGGTAAVVVCAALLAACGGSGGAPPSATPTASVTVSPSPTTTAVEPAPTVFSVYFVRDESLGVAQRTVPHTTAVATAATRALCRGPNAAERAAGLTSAVPSGTVVRGVRIDGATAFVDLSSRYAATADALSMTTRVAQVVYTLTQFPTVKAVQLSLDGTVVSSLALEGGEELTLEGPQRRADWVELEPPIFVDSPGVEAVITSPFTLAGTASVFEGSFTAQLTDDSGRRVVRVTVQATRGAPERGKFRKTIAFSTSAARGLLIVYAQSMEDGSRQDEVRIPVTFAP
jgi:germination protein M